VRCLILAMVISMCLLPGLASAQTAKSYYEAGERAAQEGRWVDAGRAFEQAVKMAPNNKHYQGRFSEVRMEASRRAVSAARLLISADRNGEAESFIEDALRFDPNNAGAAELLQQLNSEKQRLTELLHAVRKVYVDEIKGANGEKAREQIKALLVNTGRFQVLGEEEDADAKIGGLAELKEVATTTTSSGRVRGSADGSILGRTLGTSANAVTSVRPITSESVILSLTSKSGEVIWGWDDTKACNEMARAKCAINDLANAARR